MFLTFGEIMMRVAPEGRLRFRQAMPGRVDVTFAGGEANVAASLALFGARVRYLTALPRHAIAESLAGVLRGLGIDTAPILWRETGRLGIYFLETGANQRSSVVLYDRDGSAIALAAPEEYRFEAALDGVTWVHVTGITPALSENAYLATLRLVALAKERGATVSCDLNYRKKLWRWKPGVKPNQLANGCMSSILAHVDLLIGNEEDAADVLGIRAEGTAAEQGRINAAAYGTVARAILARFPAVRRVGITLRESLSADHNNWGGMLFDRETDRAYFAPLDAGGAYQPYEIRDIVDRVGGGDAFAAGLLYALTSQDEGRGAGGEGRGEARTQQPSTLGPPASPLPPLEAAIRFAVAASCLKHSIQGDFNYVTREEVAALVQGQASGRVRR